MVCRGRPRDRGRLIARGRRGGAGAAGTPAGVTGPEGVEAGDVPLALDATTTKEYEVPFLRPVTVQEVAPEVVQVLCVGDEVTT